MPSKLSTEMMLIPKNTQGAGPIRVAKGALFPASIVLEEYSKATLVLDEFSGSGSVDVVVGEGAELHYLMIERGQTSEQSLTHRFTLGKKSCLQSLVFVQDGTLTKNEIIVDFKGEGAQASLKGLSVLEGLSEVYHKLTVSHAAPGCRSEQFYKSIVGGMTS